MQPPIFIGGLMKSGTTLLRALTANHAHIFGGLETHWFALEFQEHYRDPEAPAVNRLFGFFDVPLAEHARLVAGTVDGTEFFGRFMDLATQRAGKQRWVEKTPGNVLHLGTIFARFPGSRFLHMIRDPRDVYASWKKNGKYDLDIFMEHAKRIEGCLSTRLGAGDAGYKEVRYEDLVRDPETVMRMVMAFLDEPWEEAVAVNDKGREEYERVLNMTGKASATLASLSKPIFTDSMGRWRDLLTAAEADRIVTGLSSYIEKTNCLRD